MLKFGQLLRFGKVLKPGRAPTPIRGIKPGKNPKPGEILAAKLLKTQGWRIPWRPASIYAALVLAAGAGLVVWDHAYEARREALLNPPPNVLAKNLVEDIIGQGTVHNVSVDQKAGTIDVTVEDVLVKPGQSRVEQQKNLTTEGSLAIQLMQSRLRSFKTIAVHVVKAGKPLATVKAEGGKTTPTTEFAADLR